MHPFLSNYITRLTYLKKTKQNFNAI